MADEQYFPPPAEDMIDEQYIPPPLEDVESPEFLSQQAKIRESMKSYPELGAEMVEGTIMGGVNALTGLPQMLNPETYINMGRQIARTPDQDLLTGGINMIGRGAAELAGGTAAAPVPWLVPSAMAGSGLAYDSASKLAQGEVPDAKWLRDEFARRIGEYNTLGALGGTQKKLKGYGDDLAEFGARTYRGPLSQVEWYLNNSNGVAAELASNVGESFKILKSDGILRGAPDMESLLTRTKTRIGSLYDELQPLISELDQYAAVNGTPKIKVKRSQALLSPRKSAAKDIDPLTDILTEEINSIAAKTAMEPSMLLEQKRALYRSIDWDNSDSTLQNSARHALSLDIRDSLRSFAEKALPADKFKRFDDIHNKLSAYLEMEPVFEKELTLSKRQGPNMEAARGLRAFETTLGGAGAGGIAGMMLGDPQAGVMLGTALGAGVQALNTPTGAILGGKMANAGAGILTPFAPFRDPMIMSGYNIINEKLPPTSDLFSIIPEALADSLPEDAVKTIEEARGLPSELQSKALSQIVQSNRDAFALPDSGPTAGLVVVNGKIDEPGHRTIYVDRLKSLQQSGAISVKELAKARAALNKDGSVIELARRPAPKVIEEESPETVDVNESDERQTYSY